MTKNLQQDKRVLFDRDALFNLDNMTEDVKLLTLRDVAFFASIANVMLWRTRWLNVANSAQFDDVQSYASDAIERLFKTVDFCERVADCITNNEATIEALRDAISENGLLPPSSESTPDGAVGAGESVLVTGCNFDEIYGQAVALEDYIAQVAQDLIEVVSNAPGAAAAIARIIDTVPVLGDLPVADDLNDVITWLQVQGQSTFDAGYTTTLRQDNICAMFEKSCANCELTMRDILDVYVGGGNISYAFNDPLRVLVEVVVGNVAPTAFVYGVMAFVTGALSTGGEIFGLIGLRGLQTIAATGDPDGDWSLFCNPCPTPTLPIVVTFGAGGYPNYTITIGQNDNTFGNPQPSAYSNDVIANVNGFIGEIEIDLGTPQTVQSVDFDFWFQISAPVTNVLREIELYDASKTSLYSDSTLNNRALSQWHTDSYAMNVSNVRYVRVFVGRTTGTIPSSGEVYIDNIAVS